MLARSTARAALSKSSTRTLYTHASPTAAPRTPTTSLTQRRPPPPAHLTSSSARTLARLTSFTRTMASSTTQALPSKMRAAQILEQGPIDVIEVREVDTPQPAKGQVLVKVEYAGVNFIDVSPLSSTLEPARRGGTRMPPSCFEPRPARSRQLSWHKRTALTLFLTRTPCLAPADLLPRRHLQAAAPLHPRHRVVRHGRRRRRGRHRAVARVQGRRPRRGLHGWRQLCRVRHRPGRQGRQAAQRLLDPGRRDRPHSGPHRCVLVRFDSSRSTS